MRKPLIDEQLKAYDKDGNVDRTRAPVAPPVAGTPPAGTTAADTPQADAPAAGTPPVIDEQLKTYDKDGNVDRTRAPVAPPVAGTPPAGTTVADTPQADAPAADNPTQTPTGTPTSAAAATGSGAKVNVASVYNNMAKQQQELYAQEKAAVDSFAEEQKKLQQEATDLTLQQMEQQKAEAAEDYKKEQSAAYVDYQKQTAKHGVQAEQMASMGMTGTGYHETARMAAYNAYQGRVAVARETYNKLVADYDTAMAEAKLQNSSALAEIAYTALQSGLQLMRQDLETQQNLTLAKINAEEQQKAQRAEILAAAGDFSGYQALYGLTDAQVEAIKGSYTKETGFEPMTGEELDYWEARFASAKTEDDLLLINEMMISNGLSPDVADAFLALYLEKIQNGGLPDNQNGGLIDRAGDVTKMGWRNKTSTTSNGGSDTPIVKP
ncbi:MAG: hypothetical protein IJB59_09515 [Oscillospiraceae bacterium]|nr:hypothetical protein [Oscillospiraceae bacterium]